MTPTEPDPDLVLRPGVPADAEELAALLVATRRAAEPAMPPMVSSQEQAVVFLGRRIEQAEVWVAERDDALVGFAIISGDWLHSLYVAPDHQGEGIGSALLDLTRTMRPHGFGLWVFEANHSARAFYRRHGLVELEHTDGATNQERTPDLRMVWPGEEPMAHLRGQVDEVDDELALLLARRFALAAAIQGYKEQGGHGGRDASREREIAERMASHAPGISVESMARVLDVVIAEGLDLWEARAGESR